MVSPDFPQFKSITLGGIIMRLAADSVASDQLSYFCAPADLLLVHNRPHSIMTMKFQICTSMPSPWGKTFVLSNVEGSWAGCILEISGGANTSCPFPMRCVTWISAGLPFKTCPGYHSKSKWLHLWLVAVHLARLTYFHQFSGLLLFRVCWLKSFHISTVKAAV